MGIYANRFYFKEKLPLVSDIKHKFYEITGLRLRFYSAVHLDELMTDSEDILYQLNTSKERNNLLIVDGPCFTCEDFDKIYLGDYMQPQTKSFYIECGIRTKSRYFFWALMKTMHEVGGYTFDYHCYPHEEDLDIEPYLEPYNPHERKWKRIKKWNDMSEVEKAIFKGDFMR